MDVARLNYSHGTLEEHAETVSRVRDAAGRAGRPVAILQDLPGPKLRIGPLREDVVELTAGEKLTITGGETEARRRAAHVHHLGGARRLDEPGRCCIWPTARCGCASPPSCPLRTRLTPRSRSAARSPRARG